ncbi:glycosyltransferase [Mesobacillus subterraneus]|uniref:Glycosyltransferase n=1 Tax=Mesobacillus subterraneus TaxID=285983 RepID=A0A427TW10_9BACI|nr:glycosyltransferase [Mesobacillus subterraneus]RSD28678.1 glycosyltransferase [Mesobacillus subterraneus]
MKKSLLLAFILVLSLNIAGQMDAYAKGHHHRVSHPAIKFKNDFRRLWVDHVLWTSNYITSATTAGAEDQKDVLKRLLRNQEDIGNAIKPVYGDEAGNQLTELLKEHIVIAGDLVEAAKNGNTTEVNRLNKEWYRNADDISAFLSKANPNLKEADVKEMMYMHLKLVTDDLSASLSKNWEARIVSIDDGLTHIIMMSDAIANAVIKQFPEKFEK